MQKTVAKIRDSFYSTRLRHTHRGRPSIFFRLGGCLFRHGCVRWGKTDGSVSTGLCSCCHVKLLTCLPSVSKWMCPKSTCKSMPGWNSVVRAVLGLTGLHDLSTDCLVFVPTSTAIAATSVYKACNSLFH